MENELSFDHFSFEPKISVIIPIYNTEDYLEECLESCSKQTLSEVEFILVNDGSIDSSQKITERFIQKDCRFISIWQEHQGVSYARNNALDRARGKVVMFLDSDDFLEPHACETVWDEYLENGPDIIIFKSNILADDPKVITPWLKTTLTSINRKIYEPFTSDALFCEPAAKAFIWRDAFRKTFIDHYRLKFNIELNLAEDLVFQMVAFPHASRISFIPDVLYTYRKGRKGSATTEMTGLEKKIPQHLTAFNLITDYWYKNGWLELYWEHYLPWAYNFVLKDIFLEEPFCARDHLRKIFTITHFYHLDRYIEKLSPAVYECFMNIGETVEEYGLSAKEQLETLNFQKKIMQLLMKNEMLLKKNEQFKSQNKKLSMQLEQTREKKVLFSKQIAQVNQENTDLKNHLKNTKITNTELQNRNVELQNINNGLQNRNVELQNINTELQNRNVELRNINTELQNRNVELRNINTDLQNKKRKLQNTNTELKNNMNQISKELERRRKIYERTVQELESVYLSHSWKLGNLLVRPLFRIRKAANKILERIRRSPDDKTSE